MKTLRNDFLLQRAKLPPERWGFAPNEWGFPAMDLWQKHSVNLLKDQLHELWLQHHKFESTQKNIKCKDDDSDNSELSGERTTEYVPRKI